MREREHRAAALDAIVTIKVDACAAIQ